jgi:hypothetical protein
VYLGQTFAEDAVVAPAQSAAPEAPGRREAPGLGIHDHVRDVSFHVSGEELLREFRQEGDAEKDPGAKDNGPGG